MSQKIDISVEKVAKLANIPLPKKEAISLSGQLTDALEYVEVLSRVKTDKTEPTSQVTGLKNVSRTDELGSSLKVEEALENAPDREGCFFRVPGVFKNDG
ncbi:Asp-tRNA(Asn)/Glu-tRNA(Gln) amidotransferase subunit GatC [Patescibacteria group bacterium]|nr:Asp-tRNA(Asn)/Glu-tRNA(Gln) amidotransferase subunit GatC [Patescibacteria group bacterium]